MDATQGAVWSTLAEAYVGKAQATPAEAAAFYTKGFEAFAKAIEISPDAGLYNNYALALAKNKKIDEAKSNLAKAAELDPPGAGHGISGQPGTPAGLWGAGNRLAGWPARVGRASPGYGVSLGLQSHRHRAQLRDRCAPG